MLRWVPTDVPVHRGSVGAMAVTAGSQMPPRITRPYVYRGTGEDQFPETVPPPPPPRAPTVTEYRKREVARMKRAVKRAREERGAQEPKPVAFTYQPEPVFLDDLDVDAPAPPQPETEPRPEYRVRYPSTRPARPAPGWKPLAGADLDALLDEID